MRFSDLERVKNALEKRLLDPLPGRGAQIKMAPSPLDENRFNENPNRPSRPGGVMALLYPKNNELYLPLMKRPTYNGAHGGQVSFPGGKVEKEDFDLTATALRETEEEMGVERDGIKVLGKLSDLFIIASNFKVSPTVGLIDYTPKFIPDPYEVEEVLEVSIAQLLDLNRRGVKEMRFGKYMIQSPFFDVQGHVVWGATAMMLSELIAVIEDLDI